MSSSFKIVITCSRLDLPGGIERAVTNLANLFSGKGHQVTLLILDETDHSFYHIDPSVRIVKQYADFGITERGNLFSRKLMFFRDKSRLGNLLTSLEPDIVICSEYPHAVGAVLSGIGKKSKIYSWEHHHFYWLTKSRFWNWMIRHNYPKLDAVICLNEAEHAIFRSFSKTVVIPNFVSPAPPAMDVRKTNMILTIGALIKRKGIDLLLKTAGRVLEKYPDWKWKIIGDGPMKDDVLVATNSPELKDRLILQAPVSPDLNMEYDEASIYVMTSRFEAFPMVLLEAMSHQLPCISFDCPSGPSEIIEDGKTGILVAPEDTDALVEAISSLVDNKTIRDSMGANGLKAIAAFEPGMIYKRWIHLFTGEGN